MCPSHNLELVGYCQDHEILLCGACIFEHRDHESFLLTDDRAQQIAEGKKNALVDREEKLRNLISHWHAAIYDVNEQLKTVNCSAETHIKSLKIAEKQMIIWVKEGARACVEQVLDMVNKHEVVQTQQRMSAKICRFDSELGQLRGKTEIFDSLSMVEKLRGEQVKVEDEEPPRLECGAREEQGAVLDYRKAIKRRELPICYI